MVGERVHELREFLLLAGGRRPRRDVWSEDAVDEAFMLGPDLLTEIAYSVPAFVVALRAD